MKLVLMAVTALALTACAAPPRYGWVKEGSSGHTMQSDLSKCNYQIKLQKTPVHEQDELRALCMQGEGYRKKRIS